MKSERMERNNPLTLSQYQQLLGNTIRLSHQLQGVWVTAELSDVRVNGGHCYMELVEKDIFGNTVAKTRAMIWAGTFPALRSKFVTATGKEISTGMKVMVRGSASHHNLYGLSFTINDIDPSYTVGDMERIRREILARLQKEGVIDNNRNLPFPLLPQRVAVVSAAGAAGYGDFMNQLANSPEGFVFYPHLFGAVMQGERASASVRGALDLVESTIDLWDCVVIIRGGGATTDLNGFDDYELARRVATFPIPVVVGIGHERDRTVLDELACVRCKTPTAVAAFLIDALRTACSLAVDRVRRIATYSIDALKGEKYRLSNIENTLPARVQNGVMRAEARLRNIGHSLEKALMRKENTENERINMLRFRFVKACENITDRPMLRLKSIEDMLRVLSPQNTLRRGYSITRINGKAVRSVSELSEGDTVQTTLADGVVESNVIKSE